MPRSISRWSGVDSSSFFRPMRELGLQTDYAGDGRTFLGARYALACWIDELFIVHSSWADRWKPLILEQALFGSRERATKFWEQADIVLRRPECPAGLEPAGCRRGGDLLPVHRPRVSGHIPGGPTEDS